MTVEFKNPTLPGDGRSHAVHVVVLAYFSRVIERLVKDFLNCHNKRIISVISFEDEILEEDDVKLLAEWCYTGCLESLAKVYVEPPSPMEDYDDSEEDQVSLGNDQSSSKRKGKGKAKAKNKRAKTSKPTQRDNSNLQQIPKFAAKDTIERLYCIAADLEMPEFANYCMNLIMAKYSWNFFSAQPQHLRTHKEKARSDIDRSRKKRDAQSRRAAAGASSNNNVCNGESSSTQGPGASHDTAGNHVEQEGGEERQLQPRRKATTAKHAFSYARPGSKVPFNLMLRDAPYAPHGLQFVVRKCGQDNKYRRHLRTYMRDVYSQRNAGKVLDYVDDRGAFTKTWKDAVKSDDEFKKWVEQHFQISAELDGHGERQAAATLLNWPVYMVNTNDDKSRRQSGSFGATQAAASSSSSAAADQPASPLVVARDPDVFWAELVKLRFEDVIVKEGVEGRPLRTPADEKDLLRWTRHCQDNISLSKQIANLVVTEMYKEKRDLKKFRFGDF